MSPDTDISRMAAKWLQRYDEDALDQLHLRLAELQEHGAIEAYALWLRIYDATEKLLAVRRRH